MKNKIVYALYAILAAGLYALNIPLSKLLLNEIDPTLMAGFLYLGAGIGIGIIFALTKNKTDKPLLDKTDLPYTILMVVLDVAAPILLMLGLTKTNAGSVSLLNNFEIVATSLIALVFFGERISQKLWIAIAFVVCSSLLLSINDFESFTFNEGAIYVLLATICWGIENNCTRKLSSKNHYQIVTIKGLCCGVSSIAIGLFTNENVSNFVYVIFALLLGFVAYGISITLYVKAQSGIGASKTSAFYAVNPFIAAVISLIIFDEQLDWNFFVALGVMTVATILLVIDTLQQEFTSQSNEQ